MNCTTDFYALPRKDGVRYLLANDHLLNLPLCMRFMRLVVEGDMCCSETRWLCDGRATAGPTELGQHLERLRSYSLLFSRQHTFHPYVMLFLRMYREHPIRHWDGYQLSARTETGASVVDVFEDFVLNMRAEAKARGLRKRAADWQGKFDKNRDQLVELMGKVGKCSQNLTVIELELDARACSFTSEELDDIIQTAHKATQVECDAYWSGWPMDRVEPANVKAPFEEIQRSRARLLANMKGKPTLFKQLLGYVWRVSFIPIVGYQLCASLIFDSSQGLHADLPQQIGRYWMETITEGRGGFRVLAPWPAIDIASRIAALPGGEANERNQLLRELTRHLRGPMPEVQALPYPGCNLFGTGTGSRQATKQPLKVCSLAPTTTAGCGVRGIQDRHLLGATGTWQPVANTMLTAAGEHAPVRKSRKTACGTGARSRK